MHGKFEAAGTMPWYLLAAVLCTAIFLCGCGRHVPASGTGAEAGDAEDVADELLAANQERIARGEVWISAEGLAAFASAMTLRYDEISRQMVYTVTMPQVPESDDAYLYLFACGSHDDTPALQGAPVALGLKRKNCEISFTCQEGDLFRLFVPALLIGGRYMPVGPGVYLSNPEALAENRTAYPRTASKKGLLLDPAMLYTDELTELGVKHAIYNIPLSHIMGETTNPLCPTIEYMYQGTCYYFNGAEIFAYDTLFSYLTDLGMCNTAIVLNDWNETYGEMIHPQACDPDSGAYYYMFNTAEEAGIRALEAVASFLAQRYSDGEHGMVHNWVIANEINQYRVWNYMDTDDIVCYAREFEKAFRIFYQAVRSHYANAKVYFSIDHDWNSNGGDNSEYFNARDLIGAFHEAAAAHGNYDWGVAIHPYPDPLTRVNYWSQTYDKTQDAEILTIMNLSALTDFFRQEEYLDTKGNVRNITITELGFSSRAGQKLQAAAFAYCYYIVDANPYIDALILNRQTDAPEEMRQGLAFGLYEYDRTEKYIKDVFRCIDTGEAQQYTDFMLNILGAESLEEALAWAE